MSNPENISKNRGSTFIFLGSIFTIASIVAFIYGLFWLNLVYIPAHRGPSQDLPAILVLSNPICIELLGFALGIMLVIIGFSKRRATSHKKISTN
ncbi:hypothetical protein [Ktedonobacter racemifer]|uniref:Capsular polysaccharide biosynthesis protein CapF n=1 Tax=Ktedonobacter racemifer DSM 44963 TaxID=485913 RepID=D6TN58_KTERA|nr:hypothetical protein [Ktedonobacter racemifer]EFH87208.1 capsular polysaccharide biosynthesis protein CapF [Ktedonobacter racemifer DSM 44963]